MRNERKYIVLSLLSFVLVALLLVNCGREYWRMDAASDRQTHEYVELGATLYAQNCMQCHGPQGEGVVGLTLNRPDLQGNPRDAKFADTYRMIYNTLVNGRLGRTTTHWVPTDDGSWLSYSQMPPWGRDAGGPMDEHMLQGLAYFIMLGNSRVEPDDPNSRTFWQSIGSKPFDPLPPNNEAALPMARMAADEAENKALNDQAHALILNDIKPSCVTCHTFGGRGAGIGPDLTTVGAWVDDKDEWREFLTRWVYDAPSVPTKERMPQYWYANRTGVPEPVLNNPIPADPVHNKTYMPSFKKQFDELGEDRLNLLIDYMMGLGTD